MKYAGRIILAVALIAILFAAYRKIQEEESAGPARPPSAAEILMEQIRALPEAPGSWRLLETAPEEMDIDEIPNIVDALRDLTAGAEKRVVFECYFARSNWGKPARRLIEAASSGMIVFGVLHPNRMSEPEFLEDLRAAGAQIIERDFAPLGGNPKEGYIHSKFLVTDGRRGYLGSANYSAAGMRENREMGIEFEDDNLAQSLEMLARYDAGQVASCRALPSAHAILLQGAPEGWAMENVPRAEEGVAALCDLAEREIDVMMFTFSHQFGHYATIASPLRAAIRRGVKVRLIHETRTLKDLVGVYPTLKDMKQWGVDVRIIDISSLGRSPEGQYHAKAMRVDDDPLMIGSNNWTDAGSHENREIALIVRSRRMSDQFKTRFNADWNMTGYVEPFVGGN